MNRRKHQIAVTCITLFLAILVIYVVSVHQKQSKANNLYQNTASILSGYPGLKDPYCATVGYCRIDGNGYVLIMNGSKSVYGMRTPDGKTTYIFDDQSWEEAPDGTLKASDISVSYDNVIGNRIMELMSDSSATRRYQKVSSGKLPLIVNPADTGYLQITRRGYDNCMEVMVPRDNSIGWSIIQEDGQILLYLYVTKSPIKTANVEIMGWGTIPTEAMAFLQE